MRKGSYLAEEIDVEFRKRKEYREKMERIKKEKEEKDGNNQIKDS